MKGSRKRKKKRKAQHLAGFEPVASTKSIVLTKPVSQSDAVVNVGTVVVELGHAAVADPAMLGTKWPNHPAGVAQAQDVRAPGALPLVVASDLLDGAKKEGGNTKTRLSSHFFKDCPGPGANLGSFCFRLVYP